MTAEGERQHRGPDVGNGPAGFTPLDQLFDGGSLYALRSAVTAHAAAAGMGRHQVYDVTAVAHELAANAVQHGAGHGRLRLWADEKFLYCQVSDGGRGGSADGQGAPGGPAPWPAEHGHGLWLAGQIADHVGIGHGPGGTTATVRFLLRSELNAGRARGGNAPAGDSRIRSEAEVAWTGLRRAGRTRPASAARRPAARRSSS